MTQFSLVLFLGLLIVCAVLLILEWRGLKMTLALEMKGDVKRETRWLAQYGQGSCTAVSALLVWQLDRSHLMEGIALIVGVLSAAVLAVLLKRLFSRVRPGRQSAGRFLGPSLRHANWRESFPSSHSATAVALSVMLASAYPAGAGVFWGLAIGCSALRYVLDAHWPSDVIAGVALGYAVGHGAWGLMHNLT